jgi:LPS-assembly protein
MTDSLFAKELACHRWRDFAALIVIRRLLTTLFLLTLATALVQAALPGGFDAAKFETDPETGDLVGTGDARLVYEDALLTADQIRYNIEKQTATARGHVALIRGTRRFLADEVVYHLNDKTYTVTRMRLGDAPIYASGELLTGAEKDIVMSQAKFSFHEPGPFTPTLSAERLRYIPGDRVIAEKAHLGIGPAVPIIPFTHFEQGVNEPLLSNVSARVGYSKDLGAFADVGLHVPTAPGVKLGGDVGLYTARGLLLGPSGTYDVIDKQDTRNVGSFKSGYIYDYGDRLNDVLNRPIGPNRGYIQWQDSRTSLANNFSLNTRFNYWSDSAILRDFRPAEFYPVQDPDSFVEASSASDNIVTSLFFRVQPNTFQHVQQRLPEVRIDALPNSLGRGFYQRFSASAAALRERSFSMEEQAGSEELVWTTAPTVKSNRLDAFYGLSRPIAPREWLMIDPVAGARVTHYLKPSNGKDYYTRALGELGLDASLRTSGTYAYKNERWGIDGIRHLMTPKVSYRYIPEADKGREYIPQIDDRVFDTALPTLELGDQRNIDDLSATNTLRIGLDNTLQTRDRTYGSRDLFTLNLAQDFYFRRDPGETDYSELHVGLSYMPANWMQFDIYYSFPPQNFTTRELNTRLSLHDGRVWSFSIATHYLQDQIEEYIGEGRYRINEAYAAIARLQYDTRRSRLNECTLAIQQNIDNIWSIEYTFHYYQGQSRNNGFWPSVSVRLKGF